MNETILSAAHQSPPRAPSARGETPLKRAMAAPGVLRMVLANPPANALSDALIAALRAALSEAAEDSAVRVVILAAEGNIFSAGHDLKEITAHRGDADRGRAYYADLMARMAALAQEIVRNPKPVIAEVQGLATAAGCQLVASCDLAVAAPGARFATPGVNIGLFCSTPMVALSRNVAPKHAMEMLLTGGDISAARARDIGLVNILADHGDAAGSIALELAQRISAKPAAIVRIGKRAFYEQAEMGLAQAYAHAAAVMTENMLARDAEEGIGAFLEKRKARWEG
jgi:enoyl-CoA hydratase/carnithine racemase